MKNKSKNGLYNFLRGHNFNKHDFNSIINEYATDILSVGKNRNFDQKCDEIQKDFKAFRGWATTKFL